MDNWGFSDNMFQANGFMHNHHQSMPAYADKALPPLPPTPVDTDMMLQSHTPNDAQVGAFESWSIISGSTFADEHNGMMTFDPRNQF